MASSASFWLRYCHTITQIPTNLITTFWSIYNVP